MISSILESVIRKRLTVSGHSTVIQLSSLFMQKLVDEYNGLNKRKITQNIMSNEVKMQIDGHVFTIRNRAYRDDSNDEDVEREIYKNLIK